MKSTLQKISSVVAMAIMAVSTFASAATIAVPVASAQGLIGTRDLGLEYPASTGLGSTDVRTTISKIIRTAMGLLGIVAVVIILIGGFKWMLGGGEEEAVSSAKKMIFAGIIGLAIILSAYAIASFVINQLVTATTA